MFHFHEPGTSIWGWPVCSPGTSNPFGNGCAILTGQLCPLVSPWTPNSSILGLAAVLPLQYINSPVNCQVWVNQKYKLICSPELLTCQAWTAVLWHCFYIVTYWIAYLSKLRLIIKEMKGEKKGHFTFRITKDDKDWPHPLGQGVGKWVLSPPASGGLYEYNWSFWTWLGDTY